MTAGGAGRCRRREHEGAWADWTRHVIPVDIVLERAAQPSSPDRGVIDMTRTLLSSQHGQNLAASSAVRLSRLAILVVVRGCWGSILWPCRHGAGPGGEGSHCAGPCICGGWCRLGHRATDQVGCGGQCGGHASWRGLGCHSVSVCLGSLPLRNGIPLRPCREPAQARRQCGTLLARRYRCLECCNARLPNLVPPLCRYVDVRTSTTDMIFDSINRMVSCSCMARHLVACHPSPCQAWRPRALLAPHLLTCWR